MNKKILSIIFIFGVFQQTAVAQVDDLLKMLPSDKKSLALSTLKMIPSNQRQGIEDYLAVIGIVTDGGQNVGFKNFNQKILTDNKCINELAANFYSDIILDDLDITMKSAINTKWLGKQSLENTVKDINKKPGWLWKKALEYTKGDKLLAMQIIGICGHDDTSQFDDDFRMGGNEKLKEIKLKYSEEEINNKLNEMFKAYQGEGKSILKENGGLEVILNSFKKRFDFKNGVLCPSSISSMYYAKSLGEKYDIPEKLKDRIASIQAPIKGKEVVPSKYYHVMGSAYSSCFLIRRNIPGFISKKIVMGAINAYRSSRVCEKLKNNHQSIENKSNDEIIKDLLRARENFDHCYKKIRSNYPDTNVVYTYWFRAENRPEYCYAGDLFDPALLKDVDITTEILTKKISRIVAEGDAIKMFTQSKFYKSSGMCEGEQLGTDVRDFLEENGFSKNNEDCGTGIDQKRCEAARRVLETYLVDFEWSEAQHLAGYEFAKENCPSIDTSKSMNEIACHALGKNNQKTSGASKDLKANPGIK